MEVLISAEVCQTCAERGRPNEPVFKMGMCTFCYQGLPHPRATREQLEAERMGAYCKAAPRSPPARRGAPLTAASRRTRSAHTSALLMGWYLLSEGWAYDKYIAT